MVGKPFITKGVLIENVGTEASDFKFGSINVGMTRGRIVGMRCSCLNPVAGTLNYFQVAIFKDSTIATWEPELTDCILWTEDVDITNAFSAGFTTDIPFEGLTGGTFAVAVLMNGTQVTDDYRIEIDVEVDL